ncbi:hypothetical protein MESS2_1000051 [Mesorhizobium metallidurans STM 2683]|uniref:Uncharacterized protein n=3 Tax=Mesorhizobium TaxID=68287 RepID=A0A1R3V7L4_9HYPH|nr:conserved hypothetical protein [Mesorhizobium ventifaucium]CCV03037.1 hypothetical protein MESS2_1000051 [Mesorhizobium metallidurans STM 2683]SIT55863.1 conserved hypothetical protein [Mesorhizobium prunaredense]
MTAAFDQLISEGYVWAAGTESVGCGRRAAEPGHPGRRFGDGHAPTLSLCSSCDGSAVEQHRREAAA